MHRLVTRLTENWTFQAGFAFWLLVAFLFAIFLTGGSARLDVASLVILRPVSVAALGIAILMLRPLHIQANRFLFWSAVSTVILVLVQLAPLPPAIWNGLPGRDIIAEIDQAALNADEWRPMTVVAGATSNTFYALLVPSAVFLLAIQLNREERHLMLPVILGLALLSGLLGLLQSVGSSESSLYFYRITNEGAAVGLFANRNHQALLLACLFPMLAVFASTKSTAGQSKYRSMIAIGAGIILVPLLLVTGSRAGFLLGILGLASVLLLYRKSLKGEGLKRKASGRGFYIIFGAVAVLTLAATTVFFSRGKAIERLATQDDGGSRGELWRHLADISVNYVPFGTGAGTFAPFYQLHEPINMLRYVYINQAHNDFFDLYLTSGVVGVLLLMVWTFGLIRAAHNRFRVNSESRTINAFARLGSVILLMMMLASVADYPIRTPIISALFTLAVIWLIPGIDQKLEKAGTV
jgi:lipoprotein signal peptidase